MFNVNFKTFKEATEVNKISESDLLVHLKRYMSNMNYREDYNKNKTKLNTLLKNDPVVQERMKALKKA